MNRIHVDKLEFTHDYTYMLDGELFTGIADDANALTGERCEQEIRNGLQCGLSQEWDSKGTLRITAEYKNNVLHGVRREWDDAGILRKVVEYEFGMCVRETLLASDGSKLSEYRIEDHASQLELLQLLRETQTQA